MSLRILSVTEKDQLEAAAERCLAPALASSGAAVLLCPSFSAALDAQRRLAAMPGLSLGVAVTTPSAWVDERWEVWGDGRRLVDDVCRQVTCASVVEAAAGAGLVASNPGTARMLASLARQATPWLRDASAAPGAALTDAERAVASLVAPYAEAVGALGLVEECEATVALAGRLAEAGVRVPPVALLGFSELPRAQRDLVRALADAGEVCVVVPADGGPDTQPARDLADELSRGVADVTREAVPASGAPTGRAPELDALLAQLFSPGGEGPVAPEGALRVLLPSGPAAEPELVAREVARLAGEGASDVVVCAPDAARAWRELSGRLVARGVSVRCQLSVPVADLPAGRAFMAFLRGVAHLSELDEGWPASEPAFGSDVRVRLADMSWWPPRDLSDFLLSDVSHVPVARARGLDRDWRANRLLTPAAVLAQLQSERDTSGPCAQATRELLRGRIGSAASKLLAPYVAADGVGACAPAAPADAQADAEAKAVLACVLSCAKSLKEAGLTADPAVPGHASLEELVCRACDVLEHARVQLRLAHEVPGASCDVLVTSASTASGLPAASADALVCLGMTSAESPIPQDSSALPDILAAYGVMAGPEPVERARAAFRGLLRVPRRRLVLERCLFGVDSKERYASVMMGECLACYGLDPTAGPDDLLATLGEGCVALWSETTVSQNEDARGEKPALALSERPSAPGVIEPARRPGVMAPPEGVSVEDSRPLLSASQIETYLECPYKWFSLRRLRLRDADAGFTGAEMGTFAHRVLEVTHRDLLARAVERANGGFELGRIASDEGPRGEAWEAEAEHLVALAAADPACRVAGSRVDVADPEGLEAARQALLEEFDAHLAHQYLLVRGRRLLPQALVPHTAAQRGQVEGLRRDLSSLLDFEAGLFRGYEPRLFEWSFGRGGQEVEYAGVRLTGTVDRLDVDAHGQAVVIDYKHKSDRGFAAEYDVFPKEGADGALALPRRVQSLIYGQVVRRAFPELKVTGAVYLCTKGSHELAGAVAEDAVDNVFGCRPPSSARLPRLSVPRACSFGRAEGSGMDALLDACEEAIATQVARMMAGDVEANPRDDKSCEYCPVLNCERRSKK